MITYVICRRGVGQVTAMAADNSPDRPRVDPLDPRFDLRNHSPTGFEYGYGGSGPAQLALAIVAHWANEVAKLPKADEVAIDWYQRFKWHVVAHQQADEWSISADKVREALVADGFHEEALNQ